MLKCSAKGCMGKMSKSLTSRVLVETSKQKRLLPLPSLTTNHANIKVLIIPWTTVLTPSSYSTCLHIIDLHILYSYESFWVLQSFVLSVGAIKSQQKARIMALEGISDPAALRTSDGFALSECFRWRYHDVISDLRNCH